MQRIGGRQERREPRLVPCGSRILDHFELRVALVQDLGDARPARRWILLHADDRRELDQCLVRVCLHGLQATPFDLVTRPHLEVDPPCRQDETEPHQQIEGQALDLLALMHGSRQLAKDARADTSRSTSTSSCWIDKKPTSYALGAR